MGIFNEQLHSERNTIIKAITKLNPEDLEAAIRDGEDIGILRADDDEEYISWHIHRNLLPEDDSIKAVKGFRDKLKRGNEILRILAENGVYIDGIGKDYKEYSVVSLKIVESDAELRIYQDNPKGAMWLAQSPEALKVMLAEGGDVNLKDSVGRTALHYLSAHPEEYFRPDEMMRILFENGAKVIDDKFNSLWNAAYVLPTHDEEAPLMRTLIEHGAVLDDDELRKYSDTDEWCDIFYYCRKAFVEEMLRLMHNKSQLTSSELDLITAAYTGDASAVSDILNREPNINVNVQTRDLKYTPLMFAAYSNDEKLVSRLIEAGAAVNMQDAFGRTALYEAVLNSDDGTADLLVRNGADPNIKDEDGETPYTHIFLKGLELSDIDIAGLFLNCGVNIDSLNAYGDTPLLVCLKTRHMDYRRHMMAEMLLQNGANVNAQDREGKTALMFCCKHNSSQVMRMLLQYGADTSLEDHYGNTALSIFLYKSYSKNAQELLPLLLSKGVYLGSHAASDNDENCVVEDSDLLIKAVRSYDVDGLRKLIDEGRIEALDEVGMQFAVNYVPEPDAEAFREKLNRGAAILKMLHEVDEDIPTEDARGRELSYISAGWDRFTNAYESWLPGIDTLSLHRHAASPMALREFMDEDSNPEEDDDSPLSEEYTARVSRMFSPEDFVTRDDDDDDERRAQIRASFTPDDFITCNDDEGEDNILHILALYGKNYFDSAEMVRVACEHGIDPNAESEDGALPLLLTFFLLNALCANALIKAGADITKEDSDGESVRAKLNDEKYTNIDVFREKVFFGRVDSATLMYIEVLRTLLYGRGEAGNLLIAASFNGDVRKIREALNAGADLNVQTQRGFTPLMLATFMERPEAVKVLLECGADVTIRDNFGNNVVAIARDIDSLKLLVAAGAEIDSPDKYGWTPVMFPVFPEKVAVLAERGADLNRKTPLGESALSAAADHDHYRIVDALLRAGADPEPLMKEEN